MIKEKCRWWAIRNDGIDDETFIEHCENDAKYTNCKFKGPCCDEHRCPDCRDGTTSK